MRPMLPAEPSPGRPGGPAAAAGPLRSNRNFGLFLGGSTASWAGLGVADVLFLWLVFSETGSTLAVAAVGLAQSLPPIAFGYLAGALADRYSRRRLVVLTVAAQAAVLGLVPLSLGVLGFRLWIVLSLASALETTMVVFGPSATAILPSLVESEGLDGANALIQAFASVAWAVGAASTAGLLVLVGRTMSFGLNLAIFAVGAVLLILIVVPGASPPSASRPVRTGGLRRELLEGVRFLRDHPWLLRLTVVSVAAGFFVTMFSPYLVVFTVDGLGLPADYFGYLAGAYSAGFFVGSLLSARFRVVRFFGRFFGFALLGSGGLLGLLVLVPGFAVTLVALASMGVLMGLLITGTITLVQRSVPSEMLGRYLGLEETLVWAVAPFGVVAGGLMIQSLGVRAGFGVAALGLAVVGLLAFASGRLRSVGYAPGPPSVAGTPGASGASRMRLPEVDRGGAEPSAQSTGLLDQIRS